MVQILRQSVSPYKKLLQKETKRTSKHIITKQNPKLGETYYVIHPVLKHIAILGCINPDINDF